MSPPVLHLMCGKIASGKSTLGRKLGDMPGTVLLSEDDLVASLYRDDLQSTADYMRASHKLREAMRPHILALLEAGVSVVLDFQANTLESRAWLRGLIDEADVDHALHVLVVPDEVCRARLRERNVAGEHAFTVTEAQFDRVTEYFHPPSDAEGFNLVTHAYQEAGHT